MLFGAIAGLFVGLVFIACGYANLVNRVNQHNSNPILVRLQGKASIKMNILSYLIPMITTCGGAIIGFTVQNMMR